jgi:hypothetical protein
MFWIGLIVVALGGLLLYLAKGASERVYQMKTTETSRVGDLLQLIADVRAEMGGGASELREYVEIKGVVGSDGPMEAEMSGQAAVIVQSEVTRDVEELREHRDSEGNVTTRWEKRTESVHSNRLESPFWLDDGSGRVEVRPGGADVTLQKVVDRFEQPSAVESGGGQFSFGRFSFSSRMLGPSQNFRVIGYRFVESILPLGARLYALGELSDTGEGVALHKPSVDKPYLLSTRSEEEIVQSGMSQAKWMKIGGIAALALGGIALVVGAVKMIIG